MHLLLLLNNFRTFLQKLTTTATAPHATKADTTGSSRHGYHPRTYCMFAMEYAPFGDLTSMIGEPPSGNTKICQTKHIHKIINMRFVIVSN